MLARISGTAQRFARCHTLHAGSVSNTLPGMLLSSKRLARCLSGGPGYDPRIEQEILKVKQEAKQMLRSQQAQPNTGKLSGEQIMQRVSEIKNWEQLQNRVGTNSKPFILFCLAKHCNISKQMLPKVLEAYSSDYEFWDLILFDIDESDQMTTALKIVKTPTIMLIYGGSILDGRVPLKYRCIGSRRR